METEKRGPGRPRKDANTPKRVRLGKGIRSKLNVDAPELSKTHVLRWFNDDDENWSGRVMQAKQAGWEPVTHGEISTVGDPDVTHATDPGSKVVQSVGGKKKGVLMKQRREDYEMDQADKQAEVNATEDDINRLVEQQRREGGYGDVQVSKPRGLRNQT